MSYKKAIKKMKYYITSDVHGFYDELKIALQAAGYFDDTAPHKLVILGDLFDRGSQAKELQEFILKLIEKDEVILIRGNHEDLFVELATVDKGMPHSHHISNGTYDTALQLTGYSFASSIRSEDFAGAIRETDLFKRIIPAMKPYYETANYVFVHGWFPEQGQTPEERRTAGSEAWAQARWVRWNKRYIGQRPLADKTLVCGHVPTFFAGALDPGREKNCADIFYGNGLIAIDAGTADTGQINVLVLEG
jgi:serine/threonine protein phosphatase 1